VGISDLVGLVNEKISTPTLNRALAKLVKLQYIQNTFKGPSISKNPRKRLVRITGMKYTPLENEFQIVEALESLCELINAKENIYEKALIAVLLISYIQFEDGIKRTARLTANAILMSGEYCPLS
jgi:Fic/DOC family